MASAVIIIISIDRVINSPLTLNRHGSDEGIGSTWNSKVKDLDDTAMGIRLLRQHGYHVSIGTQASCALQI